MLIASGVAHAERSSLGGRTYVGVDGGLGVVNGFDSGLPGASQTGFEVGGALVIRAGRQLSDRWRSGVSLAWQRSGIAALNGRFDILAGTADLYYDFGPAEAFIRPFLGAGLGVSGGWLASDTAGSGALTQSGVGLAYVIHGGGRFRLRDDLLFTATWHFLGTAALIERSGGDISPTMHAFMIGLAKAF